MSLTLALSGDAIITRRVSVCEDPGFRALVERFREADVGVTHLETLIHDFDGPETYPAAEAGGTWMRSPRYVAEELDWAGIDLVSHASNHALDYGYGALRSTWEAMASVDIPLAGTGETLADARAPTYLDVPGARIAMVSMTTSFTPASRAGERRPDVGGRPGLNPLGHYHEINEAQAETIRSLAAAMGMWVMPLEGEDFALHPPGLHNSLTRFRVGDVDTPRRVLDARDREGNLAAIADASRQADLVIAHNHTHAWNPAAGINTPPACIEAFSRACVDAGADIVLNQGSHAPLRGIDLYDHSPIFHDPGDLLMMNRAGIPLPMEFYRRFEADLDTSVWEARPSDAQAARPTAYHTATHPEDGYLSGGLRGLVVPTCRFDADFRLESITLTPATLQEEPVVAQGVPTRATGSDATEILAFVRDLSEPYDVPFAIEDDLGYITPGE